MKYFIATHVAYNKDGEAIFGPADNIASFLEKKKQAVYQIRHSLEGSNMSLVTSGNKAEKLNVHGNIIRRSLREVVINYQTVKHCGSKNIFIGVDPVNGLSGMFLKVFSHTSKFIYLTADYTETRFANRLVNICYHFIDRVCLASCDESWSVSSRILAKRRQQGVPLDKNKLLVNSPDLDFIKQVKYTGSKRLVIVSPLSKSLNLEPIVLALKPLFEKVPELSLHIIGSGPEEENFKKMVDDLGVNENVKFLGWKSHDEVISILQTGFLGFALYTDVASWNIYGDSMKAREYVACGLPVIINTIPSTADEVEKYQAGLVLKKIEQNAITHFVDRCLEDHNFYLKLRSNALKLAHDFDKNETLTKLLGFKRDE